MSTAEQLDIFEQPAHLAAMRSMRIFTTYDMKSLLGMSLWSYEFRRLMRDQVRPQVLVCRHYITKRLPTEKGFEGIDEFFCFLGKPIDWHIELIRDGGKWSNGPWKAQAYPGHEPKWTDAPGTPIASARAEQREDALDKLIRLMTDGFEVQS